MILDHNNSVCYDLVSKGDEVNLGYLRDSTSQYSELKTQLSAIRQRFGQVAITNIVVY